MRDDSDELRLQLVLFQEPFVRPLDLFKETGVPDGAADLIAQDLHNQYIRLVERVDLDVFDIQDADHHPIDHDGSCELGACFLVRVRKIARLVPDIVREEIPAVARYPADNALTYRLPIALWQEIMIPAGVGGQLDLLPLIVQQKNHDVKVVELLADRLCGRVQQRFDVERKSEVASDSVHQLNLIDALLRFSQDARAIERKGNLRPQQLCEPEIGIVIAVRLDRTKAENADSTVVCLHRHCEEGAYAF